MIVWIVFLVLQLLLAMTALAASASARHQARSGRFVRAEIECTVSFCLFIILGVVFLCTIGSQTTFIGLALTSVWVLMAWRERSFARLLPA